MTDTPVTKLVAAEGLAMAWQRYEKLFGTPQHGSVKQMAALLELVPKLERENDEAR